MSFERCRWALRIAWTADTRLERAVGLVLYKLEMLARAAVWVCRMWVALSRSLELVEDVVVVVVS